MDTIRIALQPCEMKPCLAIADCGGYGHHLETYWEWRGLQPEIQTDGCLVIVAILMIWMKMDRLGMKLKWLVFTLTVRPVKMEEKPLKEVVLVDPGLSPGISGDPHSRLTEYRCQLGQMQQGTSDDACVALEGTSKAGLHMCEMFLCTVCASRPILTPCILWSSRSGLEKFSVP